MSEETERESSIDVAMKSAMNTGDSVSVTGRTAPTTFSTPQSFGITGIPDGDKLFASQREPILKWLTYWIPVDIFDNWFKVVDPENPDDPALDDAAQQVLHKLNAKQNFIRLFTFERRYGTAILLCAYAGAGTISTYTTNIYETANGLNLPMGFKAEESEILQITPYPWSMVQVDETDSSISSLRFGLPKTYIVSRGTTTDQSQTTEDEPKVDWSRVIHAATRLDENSYEGESVVEAVWDDATGFRNSRWGQYETIFRVGSGFPKFSFPWATRSQIQNWISSGEITNLNARGYFVTGQEGEDVEFIGPQGVSLNPEPYNDMAFNMMAMATRIPKDMLKGVSAGTVAGSEVNERSYWNFIKSEQELVTPVVRELIDRLIDTKQIAFLDGRRSDPRKNYEIVWNFPQIVSEKDRATIDFLLERAKTESTNYLTVNEVRAKQGLEPVEDGDKVLGLLKVTKSLQETASKRPDPNARRPTEEPEEEVNEN